MGTCMQLLGHFPHGYTGHRIAGTCVAYKEHLPHILPLLPILRSDYEDPCSLWHRHLSGNGPISCLCHSYWSLHTILCRVYSQFSCTRWISCHGKWMGRRKVHYYRSLIVYKLRKEEKSQLTVFANVKKRKGLLSGSEFKRKPSKKTNFINSDARPIWQST